MLLDRSATRGLWKPQVACTLSLVLVFLCGALAGAVAMNFGLHNRLHRSPIDSGKVAFFEKVKKDLDLTPAQAEQMQSILDDFSQYYRTVLTDGKSRIMQILNEDQRRKFELILQEHQRHTDGG